MLAHEVLYNQVCPKKSPHGIRVSVPGLIELAKARVHRLAELVGATSENDEALDNLIWRKHN